MYKYFSLPLNSESSDEYPRRRSKISTPKPVSSLYKLFQGCTPEEKYLSAIRLLQGWDDPSLSNKEQVEVNNSHIMTDSSHTDDSKAALTAVDIMQTKRQDLFKLYTDRVIKKIIHQLYGDLDAVQQKRVAATLKENHRNLWRNNLCSTLKDDYLSFEREKESVQLNLLDSSKDDITVNIRYSVIHPSCFHPLKQKMSPGIDIPIQQDVEISPNSHLTVDTGVQLFIPSNLCAHLVPHSSSSRVNLYIHSGFVDSNFSSTIKLLLRNDSSSRVKIEEGTTLVQALILPILHPTLIHESSVSSYSMNIDDTSAESALQNEDESNSSRLTASHGSSGNSIALRNFELRRMPTSYCIYI